MTLNRGVSRLRHIKQAISDIEALLSGKNSDFLTRDRVARAAFERFLEIISEASRHVPDAWKAGHQTIPWNDIAAIGNRLRHAYDNIDPAIVWDIYEFDLAALETVVDTLIEQHSVDPSA